MYLYFLQLLQVSIKLKPPLSFKLYSAWSEKQSVNMNLWKKINIELFYLPASKHSYFINLVSKNNVSWYKHNLI